MNVSGVNLNLLVAFQALIDERSVTRAAHKTGITQPAMSNTLAQLRALLGDPLFTRTRSGIAPTARALALAEPIGRALKLLDSALSQQEFDESRSERTFTLAASDYVEFVLLPPLLARLGRVAPKVKVRLRSWGSHAVPTELSRGEVDLMIGFYDAVPPRHHHELLFSDEYVCVIRRGHPLVKRRLTLARYLQLSHVLVSTSSDAPGSVDRALALRGLRRQVGVRVSHFLSVPMVVARTNYVAALDRRVAMAFAKALGLVVLAPPIELPVGRVGQVWHESVDADPGHRWFRGVIAEVSSTL